MSVMLTQRHVITRTALTRASVMLAMSTEITSVRVSHALLNRYTDINLHHTFYYSYKIISVISHG